MILVTSLYTVEWPQKNINVDVFNIEESRAYIQKVLGSSLPGSDITHIDTLAEVLGRLPLALAIVSAYIKKNTMTILRYFELYEQRKKDILFIKKHLKSDQLFTNSDKGKQFTSVYITWDITIDKIRNKSLLAANWLNACACLASNDIPHFLLEEFATYPKNNPNLEIFEDARGTLHCYSMLTINEQSNNSSIHHLVQEVIRLNLDDNKKKNKNNIISVLLLLKDSFPYNSKKLIDYAKIRQLLPQVEAFLPHLEALQQKTSTGQSRNIIGIVTGVLRNIINIVTGQLSTKEEIVYSSRLLSYMANGHAIIGNAEKAREILERKLAKEERYYGFKHPEVAVTLSHLGNAYEKLEDFEKQRELQERALTIKKQHYGLEHPEVAVTLSHLGNAYAKLGDFQKQRELRERALTIKKKHYGLEHPEVAFTLLNLGNAYEKLGDFEKNASCKNGR